MVGLADGRLASVGVQSGNSVRSKTGNAPNAKEVEERAIQSEIVYTGLDTETFQGRAVLICTPDNACYPKNWRDCWEFLDANGPDFICWNVSYDARAILAFLPGSILPRRERGREFCERARALLVSNGPSEVKSGCTSGDPERCAATFPGSPGGSDSG